MTNQHPITPPPELATHWLELWNDMPVPRPAFLQWIATCAAQWGADQELEVCINVIYDNELCDANFYNNLRAARRPEPPSLKEQELLQLDTLNADPVMHDTGCYLFQMRRALEALSND